MTATPKGTGPKRSASTLHRPPQNAQLMAKREDLELQRCTAPKRSAECGQKGGQQVPARKSKENRQLPVYQSDPILRELQPAGGAMGALAGLPHVDDSPARRYPLARRRAGHGP